MIPRRFETNAVRTQVAKSHHDEHGVPLYLTSSFVFDDAEEMRASFADEKQRNIYSRFTNPNTNEFVDKICLTFFSITCTVHFHLFKYGDSLVCQGVPWLVVMCPSGLVNMLVDNISTVIGKPMF